MSISFHQDRQPIAKREGAGGCEGFAYVGGKVSPRQTAGSDHCRTLLENFAFSCAAIIFYRPRARESNRLI